MNFCSVCAEFVSREISEQKQSIICNGHSSMWWTHLIMLNLAFNSECSYCITKFHLSDYASPSYLLVMAVWVISNTILKCLLVIYKQFDLHMLGYLWVLAEWFTSNTLLKCLLVPLAVWFSWVFLATWVLVLAVWFT